MMASSGHSSNKLKEASSFFTRLSKLASKAITGGSSTDEQKRPIPPPVPPKPTGRSQQHALPDPSNSPSTELPVALSDAAAAVDISRKLEETRKVVRFCYDMDNDEKLCLGRGGFGVVYSGVEEATSVRMAIKEVPVVFSEELAALKNEIERLKDLDHRNIVQYIGWDLTESGNTFRLFIERVPGYDLARMVRKVWGPLKDNEQKLSIIAMQILTGLDYLHCKGILHRDIKCGNILVDTDASPVPNCKLCDFGLARAINTVTTGTAGTPQYMPPEVITTGKFTTKMGCNYAIMFKIGLSNKPPLLPTGISDECKVFLDRFFEPNPTFRESVDQLLKDDFLSDGLRNPVHIGLTENEAALFIRNHTSQHWRDEVFSINQMLENLNRALADRDLEHFKKSITEIFSRRNLVYETEVMMPNDVKVRHILLLCDALEKHADILPVEQICNIIACLTHEVVCADDTAMKVAETIIKLLSDNPNTDARKWSGWIFAKLLYKNNTTSLKQRMCEIEVSNVIMDITNRSLERLPIEDRTELLGELLGLTLAMNNLTFECPESSRRFLHAGIMGAFCTILRSGKCHIETIRSMVGAIRNVSAVEELHHQLLQEEYLYVFMDVLEKKLPIGASSTAVAYSAANILVNLLVGAAKNSKWAKNCNIRPGDVARRIENAVLSWDVGRDDLGSEGRSHWSLDMCIPCDACRVGQLFAVWSLAYHTRRRDDGYHEEVRIADSTKRALPYVKRFALEFADSFDHTQWQISQFAKKALENMGE